MMSHDQSFKIYMTIWIRMWKKLSSSQFVVAETIRLFTPHDISIRDSIVSMSIQIFIRSIDSYNKISLQI